MKANWEVTQRENRFREKDVSAEGFPTFGVRQVRWTFRNPLGLATIALALLLGATILSSCSSTSALPGASYHAEAKISAVGPISVPLGSGASVVILRGSAPTGAKVQVTSSNAPGGWDSARSIFRAPVHLQLTSGNLKRRATLEFPYDPANVPAGMSPADVYGIATYDQAAKQWLSVPVTVDSKRHLIIAKVSHFSWWDPFSWDWTGLASEVSQDVLQVIGQRSAAPVCAGTPPPSYVNTVNLESDASDPLRSCANTQSGILHVQMTSNRTYGMIMTYGAPVSWGWHGSGGSLVDKLFDALIDRHIGRNELYIPPLQGASLGIPHKVNGVRVFKAQPTPATVLVDVADLVLSNVPIPSSIIGKIASDCSSLVYNFTSPVTVGDVFGDVSASARCLKDAVQAVIRSGELASAEVSELVKADGVLGMLGDLTGLGSIGITLGATIGNLVLGSTVDKGLREFSVVLQSARTPPTTTTSTTETTSTTAPPLPGVMLHASDGGGDLITTDISFSQPKPVGASGVDQSVVANCGFDPSRALIVSGQMITSVNSSLAVQIDQSFQFSALDPGVPYFVLGFTSGAVCESPDENPNVEFTVQPHEAISFDFWVVLPDTITPNYPNGDPATLGQWVLEEPEIMLEGNGANITSIFGSRVVSCQDAAGDDQADYLVPAGTLPTQIGGDLYGDSCTGVQ